MEQERVLALYDAYADGVYRVALGYLRSAHDAEDAVQAVFCRLLEKELTIWPGRERAFLTKLTINHCKNQLAAAKRFAPEALDELRLPAEPGDRAVLRAVMELPVRYRGAVYLYYFEGYATGEVAELLGVPAATARTWLARGRRRLRGILDGGCDEKDGAR